MLRANRSAAEPGRVFVPKAFITAFTLVASVNGSDLFQERPRTLQRSEEY
jgi:hypothetical protein